MVYCQTAILLGFLVQTVTICSSSSSDKPQGIPMQFSLDMKDWLLQVDFSDETLPFSYGEKSIQQRQFQQEWLGKH